MKQKTNWLSTFHEGQKLQRDATYALIDIQANISYVFPNIADDLQTIIQILEKSEKLVSEAINQNMSESIKSSEDFIASALTGMLKTYEKEQQ